MSSKYVNAEMKKELNGMAQYGNENDRDKSESLLRSAENF